MASPPFKRFRHLNCHVHVADIVNGNKIFKASVFLNAENGTVDFRSVFQISGIVGKAVFAVFQTDDCTFSDFLFHDAEGTVETFIGMGWNNYYFSYKNLLFF